MRKNIWKIMFWVGLVLALGGTLYSQFNKGMTEDTRVLPLGTKELRAEGMVVAHLDESSFWKPRCSSVGEVILTEYMDPGYAESIRLGLHKGKYCFKLEDVRVFKQTNGAWIPQPSTNAPFITHYIPVSVGFGATDVDFNKK